MSSLNASIANAIIKLRWGLIGLFIAVTAGVGYFVTQFKIDASAETLLVKNNKLFIESQLSNQIFSPQEFILVAYKPDSTSIFNQNTFKTLTRLSEQFSTMDRVSGVTSILNVPLPEDRSSLIAGEEVANLTWENQQYSPEKMKSLLDKHPIFTDLLFNKEQTATAIQIVFESNKTLDDIQTQQLAIQRNVLQRELTKEEEEELERLDKQAEPIKAEMLKIRHKEIEKIERVIADVDGRAYIGGSYVVGKHLVDIIRSDLTIFGAAIFGVIVVLLLFIYRSIKWVIFPTLISGLSVFITMSTFGLFELKTTVISANFIAIQIILCLAVMIHLIGTYREIARDNDDYNQSERVKAMLEQKLAPCFYATLTTSVGFAALAFSGIQPVVDFGIMMLVAMVITMTVSLLLFPCLLSFLPATKESKELSAIVSFVSFFKKKTQRYPLAVTSLGLLFFAVLSLGLMKLDVENSFINYFKKDTNIHQQLAFIDKEFGGSTPLDIVIDLDPDNQKTDLFISAKSIKQLQLSQAVIKAFEATGSVTSLVNFTELAQRVNNGNPLTEYELDAIYELVDQQVVDQLVGAYLSEETQQVRISARIQDTTPGLDREVFLQQLRSDLNVSGLNDDDYQLTNLFVLYQDILSRLFNSQITTLGLVYVGLGLVLFTIFRSAKVALIALFPNILTTLGILGVIGWMGIPLDLMTITIAAIAMGIAVDDTIHFVHNYLEDKGDSGFEKAYMHTGVAIVCTSFIIAAGFSMFGFSDFLPSVYFGLLTATAMIFAVLTDLTILPAMLRKYVPR